MNMKVDLESLLKQTQNIQSVLDSAKEKLKQVVVIGKAGDGLVQVTLDRYNAKSVTLDPSLFGESAELTKELSERKKFIEELVVAAINDGLQEIEKRSRRELNTLMDHLQSNVNSNTILE